MIMAAKDFLPRKGQLVWVCSRPRVLSAVRRDLAIVVERYPAGCVRVRLAANGAMHDTDPDEWLTPLSAAEMSLHAIDLKGK